MSTHHLAPDDDNSVRDRLIRSADAEVAVHGMGAVKMEAVAKRAGVSRATAFRQVGTVYELLVQVALRHAKRHEGAVHLAMQQAAGSLAKIEAALIYTARELPHDPAVSGLIAGHSSSSHHPSIHVAAMRSLESVLLDGREAQEIRDDVSIDELVDFLVEQTYLAAEAEDRTEEAVRRRFRRFMAPCLVIQRSRTDTRHSCDTDLQLAVSTVLTAVEDLAKKLRDQA